MIWWIAVRNIRSRWLATLLTVLTIAIASMLALLVPMLLRQVDRGASDAVQVFDLLISPKGSPVQAVLSSLFYLDAPIGNLPYARFDALRNDPRTARAVPIGLGDSYRGYPVVGTDPSFFEMRLPRESQPYFRVRQGRLFTEPFEVVLGAQVAQASGLVVGERFSTTHGLVDALAHDDGHDDGHEDDAEHEQELRHVQAMIAEQGMDALHPESGRTLREELQHLLEEHEADAALAQEGHAHAETYTVVGILEPTGGPVDQALLVDIESVWLAHGQFGVEARQVTAVLYTAQRVSDFYAVAQEVNNSADAQAVFTGAVFAQIRGYLSYGQGLYQAVSLLVLVLAALTVCLYIYSGALERQEHVALLRALGANRLLVFTLVVVETLITSLAGVLVGIGLSYLIAFIGAHVLGSWLGFVLPSPNLDLSWLVAVLTLVPLAVLVAFAPAWRASRVSPLEHL